MLLTVSNVFAPPGTISTYFNFMKLRVLSVRYIYVRRDSNNKMATSSLKYLTGFFFREEVLVLFVLYNIESCAA